MSGNIRELIEIEKRRIIEEKKKLNLLETSDEQFKNCDKQQQQQNNNLQQSSRESNEDNKENVQSLNLPKDPLILNKNLPLIDRLDLDNNSNNNANHNEGALEERKQAFVNKLIHSENPLITKSDDIKNKMLRYGEYSPNNPQLRVTAAPYLGFGEYEQRRNHYLQKQKADYLEHLSKVQYELDSYNNRKSESCTITNTATTTTDHSLKSSRLDQRLTSAQNALLKPEMDKPKSILSNRRTGGGSPRERHLSEMKHTYTPSFLDGFSYQDRADEIKRERLKCEAYQHELRLQIEEKRRLQTMREEQERREQELENRRLEQQLLRMQEEQMIEEQRRNRRDERRHSATQQDLSMIRKSPKLQRRSNSSRFDDTLPIPVLKAHSPVAKELKNSIPFNSSSRHSSDAVRKLEDKWQIPAVQKNIINHGDPLRDGQNRSILTQLGAIRMQLQQEQLRMDESLRKRNITQSKAVDFH